ncbi:hypothetical protein vBRpoPV13_22 [Ruegeria phage vB_RpoP-V13]|uniref:Uncharacterized protein n=1 Tax=Ruegeria phage vB_RpoP-V13 TaxID=2218612 RepID=A0A2Z4QHB4_9CAUD|nr:hypothetical protein HYP63_gp22 [Ruegeria phage vB_RpoP-V13]AWY09379.1 hypothetical protein vBRpoPV13_22 [Ruegeria phage vB_RpoP-V13]
MATKTSTVTSMIPTEESPSFKKKRMKEVRTMVARAHKQGKRIDQMGFEGTDIPRAMIALQDLLTKTQERHKKATEHIAFAQNMGEAVSFIMNHQTSTLLEMQMKIGQLSMELSVQNQHLQAAHEHNIALHQENLKLQNTVEVLRRG